MPPRPCTADGHPHAASFDAGLTACTREQAHAAVMQTRTLFARTLACWAHDLLLAQHRGLHLATWNGSGAMRRAA